MTKDFQTLPTAGLVRRLMAMLYDTLLLLGIAFAFGIIVWILRKLVGDDPMEPLTGVAGAVELVCLWLTLAGYYVLCWTKRGQTLGMKSWRLCLQQKDSTLIDTPTAWLRCILAIVSALPAGLGYVWVLFDKENGYWHDRWTDTRVVLLPKEKKQQ